MKNHIFSFKNVHKIYGGAMKIYDFIRKMLINVYDMQISSNSLQKRI